MSIKKAIYEHLKTFRKYNTLENKCETIKKLYEDKNTELGVERNIFKKRREIWEQKLTEQEEEIIELKKEVSRLKREKRKKKETK